MKNVLTSYESEVTINHSAVSQERTRRLEEQLSLYRQELKRLEDDLEAAEHGAPRTTITTHTQHKVTHEKLLTRDIILYTPLLFLLLLLLFIAGDNVPNHL